MGFVALLELDEDRLVVLVFEVEHLLIEMTDRHVYIFTVLIERYRIFSAAGKHIVDRAERRADVIKQCTVKIPDNKRIIFHNFSKLQKIIAKALI